MTVRRPDGSTFAVLQMSRQIVLVLGGAGPHDTDEWHGVLTLPKTEIPLTGGVEDAGPDLVRVDLELLSDEYSVCLGDCLAQAQLLDIVLWRIACDRPARLWFGTLEFSVSL